ncbi:MAG: conjugal transfer protein TraX [Lachnospiraceae bacterium]|nr:conjugal transfer protein TraX [Lachnospiraceae bacterium]
MNGSSIKRIAAVTMFIDHIGAAFFYIFTSQYDGMQDFAGADIIYDILRIIGRSAFPLFCFLLVEGFLHTRSVKKYAARLLLFAAISEVPFDLAFYDSVWNMQMQNVFFTLFFGVCAMWSLHQCKKLQDPAVAKTKWCMAAGWIGALLCVLAAHVLQTDYGAVGVVVILVLYLLRQDRILSCIAGYGAICFVGGELWCFPAFLLLPWYNGEKGKSNKYFFYVFYPAHILLLAGIRILYLKG